MLLLCVLPASLCFSSALRTSPRLQTKCHLASSSMLLIFYYPPAECNQAAPCAIILPLGTVTCCKFLGKVDIFWVLEGCKKIYNVLVVELAMYANLSFYLQLSRLSNSLNPISDPAGTPYAMYLWYFKHCSGMSRECKFPFSRVRASPWRLSLTWYQFSVDNFAFR